MTRTVRTLTTALSLVAVLSCRDDDVDRSITVIVPAEIPSIPSGVLRMSLWSYDRLLADAPATLADADSVRFSRDSGTTNQFRMRVQANIPGGLKHYVTIRGFELQSACERYILWDGIENLAVPPVVVMRAVPVPTCVD